MNRNKRLLEKLAHRAKMKKLRSRFNRGGNKWLNRAQDTLSVAGLTPALGIFPDAANTIIGGVRSGYNYLTGNKELAKQQAVDTAFNAAAMIPVAGQGVTGAKFALRTADKVADVVNTAQDVERVVSGYQGGKNLVQDVQTNTGGPSRKDLSHLLVNPDLERGLKTEHGHIKENPFTAAIPTAKYGGYMKQMKQYNTGGMQLPGGEMQPIPGSDAVEFIGNQHDEAGMGSDSGILLDENTEVEGGETMDQVTMAKHGGKRKDYFFSDHLKKGGKSYAQHHKDILEQGGSQQDIDLLARMQEHAAGRDVNKIAKTGGVARYTHGGEHPFTQDGQPVEGHEWMTNPEDYNFDNPQPTTRKGNRTADISKGEIMGPDGTIYDVSSGKVIYQDIDGNGIDDQEEGITTYHNQVSDLSRLINENPEVKKQIMDYEKLHNVKFDLETNTFKSVAQDDGSDKGDGNDGSGTTSTTSTASVEDEEDKGLPVASDIYLPEYKDIPSYQPGVKIGEHQYYLDDAELQKYITEHEDFGGEWMQNVDPRVLEKAGITSYEDMNDPDKVLAYQQAWNHFYPDNKIQEDSDFGEQTIRTGWATQEKDDDTENGDDPPENGDDTDKKVTENGDPPKKKRDYSGLVGLSQFIPAAMAFFDKPDKMKKADMIEPSAIFPERMAKVRLERVDYNDQLSRNAADANALNKFIETSGGGPASIINRMAAYGKKQQADLEIKANETRANAAIGNQEAGLEAKRREANAANALSASSTNADLMQKKRTQDIANKMYVDEFNAGAIAATKDRRLMAVDNAVKGLAQLHSDKLQYAAQERVAQAISGQTGVYNREAYGQDLVAAGYKVGSPEYNALMKNYNKRNSTPIPPKKEANQTDNNNDDDNDTAKLGGYLARMGGYRKKVRRYGK